MNATQTKGKKMSSKNFRRYEIACVDQNEVDRFLETASEIADTTYFEFKEGTLYARCPAKMRMYCAGLFDGWRVCQVGVS
jgi:hypothetical protein